MRIGIAGPLGTPDFEHLLYGDTSGLPREMKGATLLVTLIEALIEMGHEVVAFTTEPALEPKAGCRLVAKGPQLTVHYVPRRRHALRRDRGARGRMLDLFALERRELAQAIREARPDIVHAHWSYEFAAGALDSGVPCLVTCHDSPWAILKAMPDLYRAGRLLMARPVLRRMRHATVVSPYLVEALQGMTPAPLQLVPNPLPASLIQNGGQRALLDFAAQPPRIAMLLNGWSPRKNGECGMQALALIRKVFPSVEMHLYGPGYGTGEQAMGWAEQRGLGGDFIFHGWCPYGQAMRELAGMDLLVHPALEESFGMTIAEAMALGIPVVAGRDSGAVPWVLGYPDGGGALVDVRDPQAIADAVLDILGSADVYARCSQRGRQRAVEHFSPNAVANAYLACYRQVLDAANGKADRAAIPPLQAAA